MTRQHCKVNSMKSANDRVDHYRYDEAVKDGRLAAEDKYPCALIPEKYTRDKDLSEAWFKGFTDRWAEKGQAGGMA